MLITGTVLDGLTAASPPLADGRVELWASERRPRKVTQTTTDAAGTFKLAYDPDAVRALTGENAPRMALKVYRADNTVADIVGGTARWTLGEDPTEALVLTLGPAAERVVTGVVTHTDGTAVPDVTVQAYHLGFGAEAPLGGAATGSEGRYEIHYERAEGAPDLFVRVFANGSKASIAASHVLYAALPSERIDVAVTDPRFRAPSEFARVHATVSPLLAGTDLAALDTEDVALVVEKTGLARDHVGRYVVARRIAARAKLPAEAVYGLLRNDAPASVARHLSQSPRAVERMLTRAAEANVVSLATGQQAGRVSQALQTALAEETVISESPQSLGKLLATAGIEEGQQRDLATRYLRRQGDLKEFWQGLRTDPAWGNEVVDHVQLSLQLGRITVNHPPLVKALLDRGISSARDTAKLDRQDWADLMATTVDGVPIGVPNGVRGADEQERRATYARVLARQVEMAFPTAAVAEAMRRQNGSGTRDVLTFLDQNSTFEFGTTAVGSFLSAEGTDLGGVTDVAGLAASLRAQQRLFRIAPETDKYTTMSALDAVGLDSALSVQRMGRDAFVSRFSGALGGAAAARTVYGNAVAQSAAAVNLLAIHSGSFQGVEVATVPSLAAETAGGVSELPDYRTLFGSIDFCECAHCRSVLGPAAYFVDLLAWLDAVAPTVGGTPGAVDELLRRRPDLGTVELSCDNTTIPFPYVDLINVILENAIAGLNGLALIDHDATTVAAEELLAKPEHFNAPVYEEVLARAHYPFDLPFALAGTQARVFLRELGVDRWDLMETFQRAADPTDVQVATEYLKLSTDERDLITGTAEHEQWELWGFAAETGVPDPRGGAGTVGYRGALQYVPELLRRAGIEYTDLLDLLHTDFVNGDGDLRIVSTGVTACNLLEMELERADGTLPTGEQLGHMRRLVRLRRALGFTMLDLDKALVALTGAQEIEALTVRALADIGRIRKRVKIDLLSLLTWWSAIDLKEDRETAEPKAVPLYDQVFLNHAIIVDAATWPFTLNADRSELADVTRLATPADAELQAALGLDAENLLDAEERVARDLARAAGRPVTDIAAEVAALTLNLDVLTRLYRLATLAKALKLSVADALAHADLTDLDPFEGPQSARLFIEEVQAIRRTGFSIGDLLYLLGHDAEAALEVAPSEDTLAVTLSGLRSGLQRIQDETVAEPDATGEITRQRLTPIVPAEDLDALMAVIAGGSLLSTTEQEALIDEHLAAFLPAAVAKTVLITGDPASPPPERRYGFVLAGLIPYLAQLASEALVKEQIASALGLELAAAEDLLVTRVTSGVRSALGVFLANPFVEGLPATPGEEATSGVDPDLNPTDQKVAFDVLILLHKIAAVLKKLEVGASEQVWLFDHEDVLGTVRLADLPLEPTRAADRYPGWRALAEVVAARDRLPGTEPELWELLDILLDYDAADAGSADAARGAFLTELSLRTGWAVTDLEHVTGTFLLTDPATLATGESLLRVIDAMALVTRIGTTADQVDSWRAADLTVSQAADVVMAVKSHHDALRWPQVARPLRDELRERQRAALVSWLVHAKDFEDANDLYAEFLIDVQMSPCMLTSRITQATSSVQLFIQRCFLNLEPAPGSTAEISLTAEDDARWEWMKTYRVWEANRKVFLHPENWIEPELRDDKTEIFRQLESELMQDEITDEKVETAYLGYLERLLQISRLEIVALYHQEETDDDGVVTDVLHVFGRTRGNPHVYYYRAWRDRSEWTAWEKLELDLEGDHLLAVVHERRLMLFWPSFIDASYTDTSDEQVQFWQVKLAWSEYFDGRWSAKRTSEQSLTFRNVDGVFKYQPPSTHLLKSRLEGDDLVIDLFNFSHLLDALKEGLQIGTFTLNTGDGTVRADLSEQDRLIVVPSGKVVEGMAFADYVHHENEELILTTGTVDAEGNLIDGTEDTSAVVLNKTPTPVVVSYASQYDDFCSQDALFVADDTRTFFVVPEERAVAVSADDFLPDQTSLEDVGTYDDDDDIIVIADPAPKNWDLSGIQFYEAETPEIEGPEPNGGSPRRLQTSAATAPTTSVTATASDHALALLQDTQDLLGSVEGYDTGTYTFLTATRYTFYAFYHPYVSTLIRALRRDGVEGLLAPREEKDTGVEDDPLARQQISDRFFIATYGPAESVLEPYPIEDIDFTYGAPNAPYNWETFFHAPLLIADRLRRNQRFEEALRWFHFIFDPMNQNQKYDVPARYWKVKPFVEPADAPIQELLALLPQASTDPEVTAVQAKLRAEIAAWLEAPFRPHVIARLRPTAYQKTVVMKYLDTLIQWGDQLFRRDTMETLNQATQLYVLALEILGEQPQEIPPREEVENRSFIEIRGELDELSNTLVEVENLLDAPDAPVDAGDGSPLGSLGFTPYFCVPLNEKLLGYWAMANDRLFKIRHCMNIQGVVRQLALFEPAIDPAALVRAVAAGVDLSSAIADLSAPRPHYRFTVMMQKAQAFCATVRGLGAALLAALEKRDAEDLARLRQGHEVSVLQATREVRKHAVDEAREQQGALERTRDVVDARRSYYDRLASEGLSEKEQAQVDKLMAAKWTQFGASAGEATAGFLHAIPEMHVGPFIVGTSTGGSFFGAAAEALARAAVLTSAFLANEAQLSAVKAGNDRRIAEWKHQLDAAEKELKQLDRQIAAADLRVTMAEKELTNLARQVDNARDVDAFMRDRYTNRDLYDWMVSQVSSTYSQSYQLAYDLAKRAEKCYQHELAKPDASFVQYGHWDSLKKGLLAGERLQYDLERCEASYLENDQREYEITKHVSLAAADPVALVKLRQEGSCAFTLPETIFDMDVPGLYLRRIKSVAVTVPCVVGPFTGVNCTLTLTSSTTRVDPLFADGYARTGDEDPRFRDELGVESIVTSVGQNDSGMFEGSSQDPRYQPFERRGVVDSEWQLSLASALPQFDPQSISDVILHVRYTAREGGSGLRDAAIGSLAEQLASGVSTSGQPGPMRLFSARHEFPDAWNRFLYPAVLPSALELDLSEDRFPYPFRGGTILIHRLELFLTLATTAAYEPLTLIPYAGETPLAEEGVALTVSTDWGGQPYGDLDLSTNPQPPGIFKLVADPGAIADPDLLTDLTVVAHYTWEAP